MRQYIALFLTPFFLAASPSHSKFGGQPSNTEFLVWIDRDPASGLGKDVLSDELAAALRALSFHPNVALTQSAAQAHIGIHVGNGSHFVEQKLWMGPVSYSYRPGKERSLLLTHLVAATPVGPIPDVIPSSASVAFRAGLEVSRSTVSLIVSALFEARKNKADPAEHTRQRMRNPVG